MKTIRSMEELPAKGGFYLPEWEKSVPYRATAWAYLNREDGGPKVTSDGETYYLPFAERYETHLKRWDSLCQYAENLLKEDAQKDYYWLITHCQTNGREDLIPLLERIKEEGFDDILQVKAQNYKLGICNIFSR